MIIAKYAGKEVILTAYADIGKYMERQPEISGEEAKRLLEKAENEVGVMTGFAVEKRGFGNFGEFEREMIEKAVYAQADYMLENGGGIDNSTDEPISVKLGSFSYSMGTGSAAKSSSRGDFSKTALGALEAAGVLSRRIGVE